MTEPKQAELETLKAQLAHSESIRHAEKRILLTEIRMRAASEAQVRELRELMDACVLQLQDWAERYPDDYGIKAPTERLIRELQIAMQAALRSAPPSGPVIKVTSGAPPSASGVIWLQSQAKQAPFAKTNAGEERKDLARQGCTDETRNDPAAGKRPIEAGAEQVPADEARCCAINNVGDNCLMKVGHEGICIFVPEPQDSPSRSQVFVATDEQVEECRQWFEKRGTLGGGFVSCDIAMRMAATYKAAPPSPAREKEKAE